MKVLVVGGGGREHALAWKLAQSSRVDTVFVAPGNGGTALAGRIQNLDVIDQTQLGIWAVKEKIGLIVVGPEGPLAAGIVDEFRKLGLRIFGPTRAAAQLESSKAFSKAFMQRHNIPTAAHETFSDPAAAHAYVAEKGAPIVTDHGNPVSARIAEDSTEKAPVITPYLKIARVAEEILLADRVIIDVGVKGRLTCLGKHLHANGQIWIFLVQGLDDPELEQVICH